MRISAITPITPKYNSPAFKSIVYQQSVYCTDEDYEAAKSKMDEIAAISNKKPVSNEERLLRLASLTDADHRDDYPVDIRVLGRNKVNIVLPVYYTITVPIIRSLHDISSYEEPYCEKKEDVDCSSVLKEVDPFDFERSVDRSSELSGIPRRRFYRETQEYIDNLIIKDPKKK